jgi:hypothetical protein
MMITKTDARLDGPASRSFACFAHSVSPLGVTGLS